MAAISGTIFMILISLVIDKHIDWLSKILQSVGKETFIILAFSQIFIMIFNKYFELNGIFKYVLLITILMITKYTKNTIVFNY